MFGSNTSMENSTSKIPDVFHSFNFLRESKMKTMHEILDIVQGDAYEKPVVNPDYINLVREKKSSGQEPEYNDISKEQLLATGKSKSNF